MKLSSFKVKIQQSALAKNSIWGIVANVCQTVFLSLFFVIIARKYSSADFAHFLIASTVYQIIVAFSALGLGQWFIREFDQVPDKALFTGKFIKIQTSLGLFFYVINIGIAFLLYPDGQIRWLSIILGSNILFDNIIYAIKNLNIAEFKQRKTFIILIIDGALRLLLGCTLFIYPFSIITLSVILIILRFVTTNLFIKVGSSNNLNFKDILQAKIVKDDIKKQILLNWQFVVIGSISVIYWRLANIIIAKTLTLQAVADYEISFRIFSILMILPTIASATIYTQFVKYYIVNDIKTLKQLYKKLFFIYTFFAIVSYTFVYSFAGIILPYAFGKQYIGSISCLKEMFLTMLIFPTVLLQANLIVAMNSERIDMLLNILSLLANIAGCVIGLYFVKSLTIVNYSIFASFLLFHVLQNVFLIKNKITSLKNCVMFYLLMLIFILIYQAIAEKYNPYIAFVVCFSVISTIIFYKYQDSQSTNIKSIEPLI